MPLRLEDLEAPGTQAARNEPSGAPLLLPLDLIDEDPEQPRREFDAASLAELAATIAERGVRQPVSVRPHPQIAGRWMLNFGARRLRASRLAGKADIPAFVDDAADSFDQVIENEQRDALRPMDLALFVQRQLRAGLSQAEIARRLGKSKPYITYACALIDAPEWLATLYRKGACTGAKEIYDLRRLHAENPQAVEAFVEVRPSVTRSDVEKLQSEVRVRQAPANVESRPSLARLRLLAFHAGRQVEVDLVRLPTAADQIAVRFVDDGARGLAAIAGLRDLHLTRDPAER